MTTIHSINSDVLWSNNLLKASWSSEVFATNKTQEILHLIESRQLQRCFFNIKKVKSLKRTNSLKTHSYKNCVFGWHFFVISFWRWRTYIKIIVKICFFYPCQSIIIPPISHSLLSCFYSDRLAAETITRHQKLSPVRQISSPSGMSFTSHHLLCPSEVFHRVLFPPWILGLVVSLPIVLPRLRPSWLRLVFVRCCS